MQNLPIIKGVTTTGNYTSSDNHSLCRWLQSSTARLTLQSITGQRTGMCIDNVTKEYKEFCNLTQDLTDSEKTKFLIPPANTW